MLKWSKDLSVGIREIDEQHRQLAIRASLLLERLPGSSAEMIRDTFDFFETFITDHFHTEERSMERPGVRMNGEIPISLLTVRFSLPSMLFAPN